MFNNIPLHSEYAMLFIGSLLIIATSIRLLLQLKSPHKDYVELRQRIQSWWWMIGMLFFVFILSKNATVIFFGFLSFFALKEFLSIVPMRITDRRAIFWLYLSIPVQYYWVNHAWYGMFIIFIPVYIFLFIPIRLVLIGDTRGFIKSAGVLHWSVMLTVFSISHIAYLLVLPIKNETAGGVGLIIYLLFMTQFNDVCQFIWGKLLGKHKIIPKVSPNKTWEGFVGGFITLTMVSGFIAPYLTPLTWLQGLGSGVIICIAGFFGDVVLSSVKRDLRIKDSSQLIPGHGGILDRIDSLIYTAPLFFHYLYFLYY